MVLKKISEREKKPVLECGYWQGCQPCCAGASAFCSSCSDNSFAFYGIGHILFLTVNILLLSGEESNIVPAAIRFHYSVPSLLILAFFSSSM